MKTIHLAAALGAAACALGLAATGASAQEGKTRTERVIVMTDANDHDRDADGGPRVRAFTLGDGGASCSGTKDEVSEQSADGREKTHVLFCVKGDNVSSAERAERLQHALTRIEQNDELSAEHKAKVVAALRDAIARLQATP
jgi:hypothetical protein